MGLLVVDPESEAFHRQHGIKVTAAMADASRVPFQVRKLRMTRSHEGYGFLLKEEKYGSGKIGQFLREVDRGLPAEKAGMREGDRLLAVNGEITEDMDHQEVVLHIRADSSHVTLLVIDEEGSNFYDLVGLSPLLFYDEVDLPTPTLRGPRDSSCSDTLQRNSDPILTPCLCHLSRGPRRNEPPPQQPSNGPCTLAGKAQDGLSQAF